MAGGEHAERGRRRAQKSESLLAAQTKVVVSFLSNLFQRPLARSLARLNALFSLMQTQRTENNNSGDGRRTSLAHVKLNGSLNSKFGSLLRSFARSLGFLAGQRAL